MKWARVARAAAAVIVVGWLFVVVVSYYFVHKPFAPGDFFALPGIARDLFAQEFSVTPASLANVLGDMLVVALLIFFASALGHFFLRRIAFDSALEAIVLYCGIGLGALGLVVFALAVLGVVNGWVYGALVLGGFVLLRNDAIAVLRNGRAIALPRAARGENALALFCALALGITFLLSFAPPWGWDGIQYHLITPKLILQNGRVTIPPDNLSLNNPNLVEMLFLAGMVLKGDGAAQALHWIFLPLTLGAMLMFAARYFSWRAGWLAAALLCAVPTVLLLSTWAYNDLALTFFTFTAFVYVLRARETRQTRFLILAGALCGFAFGEKVTAFFVPLALAVLLMRRERAAVRDAAIFLAIAFALGVPWWLRNLVLVGNPIYPFVFGGRYWDAFRTAWYTRFGSGLIRRPWELLWVPWTMTIQGTQSGLFQGTLGPLLLALLPLNLLPSQTPENASPPPTRAMWFFVAALYLPWLLGVAQSELLWQSRLLLPAFPLLALLAARGLEKLSALEWKQFSAKRFASLVIAVVFGISAVSYTLALLNDGVVNYFLFAPAAREKYLVEKLGAHYAAAQWVNANLPRDAKILFLWEPRTYYFEPYAEADAILDRFAHLRYLYPDVENLTRALVRGGYTHVLLYREGLDNLLQTGYDPITADDLNVLSELVAQELEPVNGRADLGLTTRNGRPALERAAKEPYAIYKIKTP
jgi:hypothetical protein